MAEGPINILYHKELSEADKRLKRAAELAAEYRAEFALPFFLAEKMFVNDVIESAWTHAKVGFAVRPLLAKRENQPAKKHVISNGENTNID